jgi:peptidoglycan/LPS O-acetylase OafA/YrhL
MCGFSITLATICLVSNLFGHVFSHDIGTLGLHFLPGIHDLFMHKSIDGIIWTLDIEIKFYLLCALLVSLFHRCSLAVLVLPIILFGAELLLLRTSWSLLVLDTQVIIYMFCGVALHFLFVGRLEAPIATLALVVAFTLFALCGEFDGLIRGTALWSYGFALVFFIAAMSFPGAVCVIPFSSFFAKISYPLYAIHGVTGYAAIYALMTLGAKSYVSIGVVGAAAVFLSYVVHRYLEEPTQVLGRTLADNWSACRTAARGVCDDEKHYSVHREHRRSQGLSPIGVSDLASQHDQLIKGHFVLKAKVEGHRGGVS